LGVTSSLPRGRALSTNSALDASPSLKVAVRSSILRRISGLTTSLDHASLYSFLYRAEHGEDL
jgi:hypothetical protein